MVQHPELDRAALARKGSPFLNTAQAAHYLGICQKTLDRLRWKGTGPRHVEHGQGRGVRYHIDELDRWSQENTCRRARNG